jgi:hypothetical protein
MKIKELNEEIRKYKKCRLSKTKTNALCEELLKINTIKKHMN